MANTPLKPEDMNKFAGQMVEAESPMFDLLPKGCTIVVGGVYRKRASDEEVSCHICHGLVFLNSRDRSELAGETVLCILCPDCYFKMEPKEAQS